MTAFAKGSAEIKRIFESMKPDDAVKAFKKLGVDGGDLVKILDECGVSTDKFSEALQKSGKSGGSFVTKLKAGFEGLAKSIGMTPKALLGWIGGITAVVGVLTALSNVQKKMYENAQDGVATYKEQTESLSTYKTEIASLESSLDSGNLSEQEAYDVRSRLLQIQDELIVNFGSEAKALDLLTMSAQSANAELDKLEAKSASEFLTKNATVIRNASKALEEVNRYEIGDIKWDRASSDVKKQIQDVLNQYDNAWLEMQGDAFSGETTAKIIVKADVREAKDSVVGLATDFRTLKSTLEADGINLDDIMGVGTFESSFESALSGMEKTIDKYSEIYETANLSKITETKSYSQLMSEMETAQKAYTDAVTKSYDTEEQRSKAIADAMIKMVAAKEAFTNMDFGDDLGVQEIFEKMMAEINSAIMKEQLRIDITATVNGEAPVQAGEQILSALKAFEGEDGTVDPYSIKNAGLGSEKWGTDGRRLMSELSAQERAYLNLKAIFEQNNMTLDEGLALLQEMGLIQKVVADGAQETAKSYAEMVTSAADCRAEFSALSSAASEQGYSGNITPETYDALIAKSKDYAACVEYQNGALQLNTEKAYALFDAKNKLTIAELELQKVAEATTWKENAEEIERLERQLSELSPAQKDVLKNLRDENDTIAANIKGYDVQIAALEELTSAYGKWKAVSESDNSDSMYKDLQKAFEQIKEAQEAGQIGVGNVVYQAAVELLVPEKEDVSKYLSTLKRYITEDTSGLDNFITDMVSKGLMTRAGDSVEMVAGATIEDICKKLTITPEMAKAIFNALEMYDFDFKWTDEDFNIDPTLDTTEIDAQIADLNARIDALKESGATVEVGTNLSVDDLIAQRDKLMEEAAATPSGGNTIDYIVNVDSEEASTVLESIKTKLDEIAEKIEAIIGKEIGDLGGSQTIGVLQSIYDKLKDIDNLDIKDKSFNVIQNNTSTGGSSGTRGETQQAGFDAMAKGTTSADPGVALLGDEYSPDGSPRPELVITDDTAYIAGQDGPEIRQLNAGDIVYDADQTKEILKSGSSTKDAFPRFAHGLNNDLGGGGKTKTVVEVEGVQISGNGNPDSLRPRGSSGSGSSDSQNNTPEVSVTTEYTEPPRIPISSTWNDSGLSAGGVEIQGGFVTGEGGVPINATRPSGGSTYFEDLKYYYEHLVSLGQMSEEDYVKWLSEAIHDAYESGEVDDIREYRALIEEVFEKRKELFNNSLDDVDHQIEMLSKQEGNANQIIATCQDAMAAIEREIDAAIAAGMDENDDYIQDLQSKWWDYADQVSDIQEEITDNAKSAVEDLIDYRIDMLKQDLENEKDALDDKLSALKDFYDDQKEMLQDQYDEEKYLEEQAEKRKAKSDIEAELAQLQFDDSAWAEKRKLELQEELNAANKELSDFEKDHALQNTQDMLDKMYEQQEAQIQSEIEEIDARLNDPNALYNQALKDIQNNTLALYEEMVAYNNAHGDGNPETVKEMWDSAKASLDEFLKTFGEAYKDILLVESTETPVEGYASGTSNATPGIKRVFEEGDEYIYTSKDGTRYRMFSGGEKVLNAKATDFLYRFANNGGAILTNMFKEMINKVGLGLVNKTPQIAQLSTGDIIIQGNADHSTVSEIRRAQRENVDYMLREFIRLNR